MQNFKFLKLKKNLHHDQRVSSMGVVRHTRISKCVPYTLTKGLYHHLNNRERTSDKLQCAFMIKVLEIYVMLHWPTYICIWQKNKGKYTTANIIIQGNEDWDGTNFSVLSQRSAWSYSIATEEMHERNRNRKGRGQTLPICRSHEYVFERLYVLLT